MYSKRDNIEIMINVEAHKVIEELFKSLLNIHPNNLQESRKISESVLDYIYLFYYKWHKINPNREGSYTVYPNWIKNEKTTIKQANEKDDKCFQYDVYVVLIHEEVKKDLQKITKIKRFISKYNCEEINFPSEKNDWKKIEKNNRTIAINVLYAKNISCLCFKI